MGFIEDVSHYENYCEARTCALQKSNLQLSEELLNFYHDIYTKQIKDEKDVNTFELAIILIHGKIIRTLQSNLDLIKKGHYSEFRSLLRDTIELIFLSKYLMVHPERGDLWLDGEQIGFGFIADKLNLPIIIRKTYGELCDFTHPNFHGTKENIILDGKKEDIDFLLVPMFRRKIVKSLILLQISFTLIAVIHFFICFKKYDNFSKDDEKKLKRLQKKLSKPVNSLTKYCEELQF